MRSLGKVFTTVCLLIGVGVIVSLVTVTARNMLDSRDETREVRRSRGGAPSQLRRRAARARAPAGKTARPAPELAEAQPPDPAPP